MGETEASAAAEAAAAAASTAAEAADGSSRRLGITAAASCKSGDTQLTTPGPPPNVARTSRAPKEQARRGSARKPTPLSRTMVPPAVGPHAGLYSLMATARAKEYVRGGV
eukprot:scaffold26696_cov60-Phaeocystis_antarctica.AAC.1